MIISTRITRRSIFRRGLHFLRHKTIRKLLVAVVPQRFLPQRIVIVGHAQWLLDHEQILAAKDSQTRRLIDEVSFKYPNIEVAAERRTWNDQEETYTDRMLELETAQLAEARFVATVTELFPRLRTLQAPDNPDFPDVTHRAALATDERYDLSQTFLTAVRKQLAGTSSVFDDRDLLDAQLLQYRRPKSLERILAYFYQPHNRI